MIAHHLPTLALMLALMLQADPGFVMWSVSELEGRNKALGAGVGPDGSARETLADYGSPSGSHWFRFIRRDRDGRPEQHDNIDDVVYIQSGEGTLLVGGEMLDRPGDLGTSITGGWRYPVAAGATCSASRPELPMPTWRRMVGTSRMCSCGSRPSSARWSRFRTVRRFGWTLRDSACGNLRSWKSGIEPSGPGWGRMIPLARRLPTTAKVASLTAFDSFAGMGTDGPSCTRTSSMWCSSRAERAPSSWAER